MWLSPRHIAGGTLLAYSFYFFYKSFIKRSLIPLSSTLHIFLCSLSWFLVVSGVWYLSPWFTSQRIPNPIYSPGKFLLSHHQTSEWYRLGLGWKENISWICAFICTFYLYISLTATQKALQEPSIKKAITVTSFVLFIACLVSALLGSGLAKIAPNLYLHLGS
jgi:hypothetical protein